MIKQKQNSTERAVLLAAACVFKVRSLRVCVYDDIEYSARKSRKNEGIGLDSIKSVKRK